MKHAKNVQLIICDIASELTKHGKSMNPDLHGTLTLLFCLFNDISAQYFKQHVHEYMNNIKRLLNPYSDVSCIDSLVNSLENYVILQLAELAEKSDDVKQLVDELGNDHEETVFESEKLQTEHEKTQAKLKDLQLAHEHVIGRNNSYAAANTKLMQQLDAKIVEYESLRERCVTMRDKLVTKSAEFKSLQEKYEELVQTEAHVRNKFKHSIEQLDKKSAECESLKRQLADFDNQLEQSHEEKAILGDTADKYQRDSNELGQIYIWLARNGLSGATALEAVKQLVTK